MGGGLVQAAPPGGIDMLGELKEGSGVGDPISFAMLDGADIAVHRAEDGLG